MVEAERKFTDEKVKQLIDFKRTVCTEENGLKLVVINQKGIDPLSLDMLAKDGILALRRAKVRNFVKLPSPRNLCTEHRSSFCLCRGATWSDSPSLAAAPRSIVWTS